jgi:hypothetical protein
MIPQREFHDPQTGTFTPVVTSPILRIDDCFRCGRRLRVALAIPVEVVEYDGGTRIEYATFCASCARRVKR